MKKKNIIGGILATSIIATSVLGGCSQVSSNPNADMSQVLAEVNISENLDKELKDYSSAVGTSEVIKRELVTYFINAGSNYINNYGWNYEQTFTRLMSDLVDNAVLVQYATLYLLKDKAEKENKTAAAIISEYEGKATLQEKYEYLLGEDSDEVKLAEYSLMRAINNAIDSQEKKNNSENNSTAGTDKRDTPTGVDTELEDYYPKKEDGSIDYKVYTGYENYLLSDSGVYQENPVEGTTRAKRMQAYNDFISSLVSLGYNLVDKSTENLRDVMSLNYIKEEYLTQLEQQILNKYYDLFEEEQEEKLIAAGQSRYSYIQSVYEDLLGYQEDAYSTSSALSSALSGMSDSQFVLYAPDTREDGAFGFVYNILLPFSATQSAKLTELQSMYKDSEADGGYKPEYYIERNNILKLIEATDQRSAWFNGEKEYAFKAEENAEYFGDSGWLFFENNIKYTDRYEALSKYDGRYAYNGSVVEKDEGYVLIPEKLTVNSMLDEFVDYVNYVTGNNDSYTVKQNYYNLDSESLYKDEDGDKKINYENFVYAEGKISLTNSDAAYNRSNLLYRGADNKNYKALAAVNELQYAYTTDTSVLSQYIGYSVDAGDTSYIKEFEYAAHKAINKGAGNWVVCAGDYGWHLIYVTYTFSPEGGAQYTPNWEDNVNKEGTFENLFYEMVKTKNISNISTTRSTQIINEFKSDDTVTTYQTRYQDLLDMDK